MKNKADLSEAIDLDSMRFDAAGGDTESGELGTTQIRVQGRNTEVPALRILGREIVVIGRVLKTAVVKDEAFVEGVIVPDPPAVLDALRQAPVRIDVFSFARKFWDPAPLHGYPVVWDNFAVLPVSTYEHWIKTQVKKDVRENVRRAAREGVVARLCSYDDAFVRGIKSLCDETPVRQGKRFWHFGKSLEDIREIHGTYVDRALYVGAFLDSELIGFLKMVCVDDYAKTMHVISKERFFHKRTVNALIAKAVEVCASRNLKYLIYGEYSFPGKPESSLSRFKQHHGFEEVKYPRYHVPLTGFGTWGVRLGLHRPAQEWLPPGVTSRLRSVRALYYRLKAPKVDKAASR